MNRLLTLIPQGDKSREARIGIDNRLINIFSEQSALIRRTGAQIHKDLASVKRSEPAPTPTPTTAPAPAREAAPTATAPSSSPAATP